MNKLRGRTPSGQVLCGKVSGITTIFNEKYHDHLASPFKAPLISHSANSACESTEVNTTLFSQPEQHSGANQLMSVLEVASETNNRINDQSGPMLLSPSNLVLNSSKHSINMSQMECETPDSSLGGIIASQTKLSDMYKRLENMMQPHQSQKLGVSESQKEMPQYIDIRVVMGMFSELKTTLQNDYSEIKHDVSTLAATGQISDDSKSQFKDMERAIQLQDGELTRNKNKWKNQQFREEVIYKHVSRLSQKLDETIERLERMEINNSKRMMSVSGFYADQDKKKAKKQLSKFFNDEMHINPYIEDLYFVGGSDRLPPNIIITFETVREKQLVYKNIEKIKNLVNKDGAKMYFNDFLTTKQNEMRKKERYIKKENAARDSDLQVDISFKKGILHVDSKPCQDKVRVPDPTQVIKMPLKDLNEVMDLQMNVTPPLIKKGNQISAISIPVQSFEEINKAYLAVKLRNADARHIVAVWNIPTENIYDGQNFCEDDEFGVGIPLLNMLLDNDITHRAIFLVRRCGEKLNADRIPCYKQALAAVVRQAPFNKILQKEQSIHDETDSTTKGNKSARRGYAGQTRKPNNEKSPTKEKRVYIPKLSPQKSTSSKKQPSPSFANVVKGSQSA